MGLILDKIKDLPQMNAIVEHTKQGYCSKRTSVQNSYIVKQNGNQMNNGFE